MHRSATAYAITGAYAIVDRPGAAALALADALLSGPVRPCVLQVRLKTTAAGEFLSTVCQVLDRAREAHVPVIVNDRLDIAIAAGADGVHLGQTDLTVEDARAVLARVDAGRRPHRMLIGVSTHTLAQVDRAVRAGADYLGYGPVFATATKANPDPVVGLDELADAVVRAGSIPVVAIGGVTPKNAADVARTGAAAACAISAVNAAADPAAALAALAAPFA